MNRPYILVSVRSNSVDHLREEIDYRISIGWKIVGSIEYTKDECRQEMARPNDVVLPTPLRAKTVFASQGMN